MLLNRTRLLYLASLAAVSGLFVIAVGLAITRKVDKAAVLGPPMELHITKMNPLLDLDSGELLARAQAPNLGRDLKAIGDWAAKLGVDGIGDRRSLSVLGMKTRKLDAATEKSFAGISPEKISRLVGKLLSEGRPQNPIRLKTTDGSNEVGVFVFNTREGANGVMHIRWDDKTESLRLAYRLLMTEPIWEPDSQGATFQMRGRVLKPNGAAADGAAIRVFNAFTNQAAGKTVAADTDGRFELTLAKAPFAEGANQHDAWRLASIIAEAEGCAATWAFAGDLETEPAIRLAKNDITIRGLIVDLEGQPVEGAQVEVAHLMRPRDIDFARLLAQYKAAPTRIQRHLLKHSVAAPGEILRRLKPRITDKQGRFELQGVGNERIVLANVSGPGVEGSEIYVLTRNCKANELAPDRFNDKTKRLLNEGSPSSSLYPADFVHVAAPGYSIYGVVRDRSTGDPIAGVDMLCNITGQRFRCESKTGADGSYALHGIRKGSQVRISVRSNPRHPYPSIDRSLRIDDNIRGQDFQLSRGIRVAGKVTLAESDQVIRGRVFYFGFGDNERLDELGGSLSYYNSAEIDREGSYALYVPPGPGLLAVKAYAARGSRLEFANAKSKDFGSRFDKRGYVVTTFKSIRPHEFNAAKVISPLNSNLHLDFKLQLAPK